MDVVLLNLADMIDERGQEKEYLVKQAAIPPLGLLYLGQVLVDNGYSVKVYDQPVTGATNSEVMKIIKKMDPKVVGFSILIDSLNTAIDLFNRIKEWNPNIITVAGNYFATFFPEKLMQEIKLDFCVRGEGEYILLDLVNHLFKDKKNYEEIKGLTYRGNNIIKSTPMPEKIQDLDAIPIPDRKLIDFNYRLQRKSTSIVSSRGCPFNCRFCYFTLLTGKKWRSRSVENVIEEIKLLKDRGYKEILFADDNFALSKKRIYKLSAAIKRNQLDDLDYSGDCRIDNVSLDLCRALVAMNCKKMTFGMESGNQRLLDYYEKGITLDQIKQAVKIANKARMEVIYGSFVLGAPDETFLEAVNTIKFANKLDLTYVVFQILNAIPIMPIYQELVENGLYTPTEEDWKKSLDVPDISATAIPKAMLYKLLDEGFIRFFNKKRFAKIILKAIKDDFYVDSIIHLVKSIPRRF